MTWGCQGYIVVGVYQGTGTLDTPDDYIPPEYRDTPKNPKVNGNIHSILVLGPIDSPHQEYDKGWFQPKTPRGTEASMHRVLHRWSPKTPFKPEKPYGLGGGFMLMTPRDIDGICHVMAREVLRSPGNNLFTNCNPPIPKTE